MGRNTQRWMPLREFQGKDAQRRTIARECFVDRTTLNALDKTTVFPHNSQGEDVGWSGNPPNLPSGSPEREQTDRTSGEAYREGWERVFEQRTDQRLQEGSADC